MSLRSGHGTQGPRPAVVEVRPADELPEPLQAPEQAAGGPERDEHGRWVKGARRSQARGGRSKQARIKLAVSLGLGELANAGDMAPFLRDADDFAKAHAAHLAEHVGGGRIGPDVGSMIQSASKQLAAGNYVYAIALKAGGDPELLARASRFLDSSRQNLIAAYEVAARTAKGRPVAPPSLFVDAEGGEA